jgi:hypothetical protein
LSALFGSSIFASAPAGADNKALVGAPPGALITAEAGRGDPAAFNMGSTPAFEPSSAATGAEAATFSTNSPFASSTSCRDGPKSGRASKAAELPREAAPGPEDEEVKAPNGSAAGSGLPLPLAGVGRVMDVAPNGKTFAGDPVPGGFRSRNGPDPARSSTASMVSSGLCASLVSTSQAALPFLAFLLRKHLLRGNNPSPEEPTARRRFLQQER